MTDRRMPRTAALTARAFPALLAATLLAACATTRGPAEATTTGAAGTAAGGTNATDGTSITELMGRNDARLETYRIDTWSAPSDESLVVESLDGTRYRATFMGHCLGLRFTDTIGFVTRGTNSIDQFSGIVLPDGTRCTFQSFQRSSPGPASGDVQPRD